MNTRDDDFGKKIDRIYVLFLNRLMLHQKMHQLLHRLQLATFLQK